MEKDEVKNLLERLSELNYDIATWGVSNSQSNPGAVMNLRWMKKEVKKIEEKLSLIKLKPK
jgi:hypothetical protein